MRSYEIKRTADDSYGATYKFQRGGSAGMMMFWNYDGGLKAATPADADSPHLAAVMLYLAQLEDWPDAPAIIANELAIYPAVTLAWGFRSAAIEYINGVRAFSTPLTR